MDVQTDNFDPREFAWQGLTLTSAAAEQVKNLTASREGMLGMRLGVKQTGCAGFGYVLDTVKEPHKDLSLIHI